MYTKESSWNPDEIIDTRKLQLFCLKEFMQALGYTYVEYASDGSRFESVKPYNNKGRSVIGVSKAINLYNNNSVKCIFGKPPAQLSIWSFDDYRVAKAKASRILRAIKLQYCKQTKQILVQDHRVVFTLESYKNLFLGKKYLE